ncbi:hypothetical protein SAMN05445871_0628 [Paraburkholderia caballeronis]|uniref:Uncharacterized protein n=1 Tax=Paraburkholderia caballeronis TaxID=416943 RepID=A0A1H7VEY8_9BURK|nr:hypothetical protein C7403_12078 [Paraburkholderia caballeronis]PXW94606.1 hypothetical protein C7407_1202 [Paraburkholderia caballeronis]RAJ90003.1 hypothetical protein C7409_12078 [Paraburkholderia caballeronis]SEB58062.1 hypothetical protein SAMN05445871_0628 [Paraburkholderia caballeronis]SEM07841.1 hypothetical protein SAMN05192542_12461 [Paraburkholderia caballeronis]
MTEHPGVDIVQLTGDGFEQRLDARACDRTSQAQALTLGESHGHKLASPGDQSRQILLCGIAQRTHEALAVRTLGKYGSEFGEGGCIDAVGFGEALHRTSEVTSHARVDHRHTQPGCLQCACQCRLIAAGSLHQHKSGLQLRQGVGQRDVPLGVIADMCQFGWQSSSQARYIDMGTRHIDAHHYG